MPILRKNNKEQFTTIQQGVFRDTRLSLKDVGLLVSMLALPDNWEFSENGLEAIFKNDGQTSIRTALKNLEKAGYLKRERERDKRGRMGGVAWHVSDEPRFLKPSVEKPDCEIPSMDNQPQSITKESIIKESTTKQDKSDTVLPNNTAKKKESNSTIFEIFANGNQELLDALKEFEDFRKKIKKPMTDRAKQLLINNLQSLSKDEKTQIEIINQSILKGWTSVYALKASFQPSKPTHSYNYDYGTEGVDYL